MTTNRLHISTRVNVCVDARRWQTCQIVNDFTVILVLCLFNTQLYRVVLIYRKSLCKKKKKYNPRIKVRIIVCPKVYIFIVKSAKKTQHFVISLLSHEWKWKSGKVTAWSLHVFKMFNEQEAKKVGIYLSLLGTVVHKKHCSVLQVCHCTNVCLLNQLRWDSKIKAFCTF